MACNQRQNSKSIAQVMQESFNNLEVLQTEKVLEKITSLKREKGPFDDDFSIVELILNT